MDELHFDDAQRVRILEQESFADSSKLRDQCNDFVNKMAQFDGLVDAFVGKLDRRGQAIEAAKLQAIGQRLRLQGEDASKQRRRQELEALITEKQRELERFVAEGDALGRVLAQQEALLAKLNENQA
eukprot:c13164_g1_i2.p2 GENE.c13164_g1_i2~~c13164_g1_i2.p2  ORF type:complete len:127 (+),score=29.01 c13164_g1_i2:33-413(+)